jgi:hypothetical protein
VGEEDDENEEEYNKWWEKMTQPENTAQSALEKKWRG